MSQAAAQQPSRKKAVISAGAAGTYLHHRVHF